VYIHQVRQSLSNQLQRKGIGTDLTAISAAKSVAHNILNIKETTKFFSRTVATSRNKISNKEFVLYQKESQR
jgi:hypothetical protein